MPSWMELEGQVAPKQGGCMEQPEQKRSGLGFASFVTSIIVGILFFLWLIADLVMSFNTPGGLRTNSVQAVILGLLFFVLLFGSFVALGLRLVPSSKKIEGGFLQFSEL